MVKPIDLHNLDAMNAPIKRPLCADPKPMTPLRILRITASTGEFVVTWHYRNDNLRRAVARLCASKALWCSTNTHGQAVYVLHRDFDRSFLHA